MQNVRLFDILDDSGCVFLNRYCDKARCVQARDKYFPRFNWLHILRYFMANSFDFQKQTRKPLFSHSVIEITVVFIWRQIFVELSKLYFTDVGLIRSISYININIDRAVTALLGNFTLRTDGVSLTFPDCRGFS